MPSLEEKHLPAEELVTVLQPEGSVPAVQSEAGVDHNQGQAIALDEKHVDDTGTSSDEVVEPKQEEQSMAAELGKGKVALIMSALCVSVSGGESVTL